MIIAGKDKGKSGKILRAFPKEGRVIVDGMNVRKMHKKATKSTEKGSIVERSLPIHASNVKLVK
ncbi:MAG: ribosomal protein [Parcubacteria group bacterium]|nr:ribosomal protein [Parcubacteria group bacterium]